VHYTAGVGTAFSFAGASLVPGQGVLSTVARLLLDGAGALFGLYLLLAVGLSAYGRRLRRSAPCAGAGLSRPIPARLPDPAISDPAAGAAPRAAPDAERAPPTREPAADPGRGDRTGQPA